MNTENEEVWVFHTTLGQKIVATKDKMGYFTNPGFLYIDLDQEGMVGYTLSAPDGLEYGEVTFHSLEKQCFMLNLDHVIMSYRANENMVSLYENYLEKLRGGEE